MGSEKYPYKGIIDHFANRGFSNGTNAWTDTDHTAYTVSTAGEAGFLQILPIYVDHILYPTITKAGFTTEVCRNFLATYTDPTSSLLLGASH
jgi:Zn-dependent M16 (insulinase) family peptidase